MTFNSMLSNTDRRVQSQGLQPKIAGKEQARCGRAHTSRRPTVESQVAPHHRVNKSNAPPWGGISRHSEYRLQCDQLHAWRHPQPSALTYPSMLRWIDCGWGLLGKRRGNEASSALAHTDQRGSTTRLGGLPCAEFKQAAQGSNLLSIKSQGTSSPRMVCAS